MLQPAMRRILWGLVAACFGIAIGWTIGAIIPVSVPTSTVRAVDLITGPIMGLAPSDDAIELLAQRSLAEAAPAPNPELKPTNATPAPIAPAKAAPPASTAPRLQRRAAPVRYAGNDDED